MAFGVIHENIEVRSAESIGAMVALPIGAEQVRVM
jgi:hypothetical protein